MTREEAINILGNCSFTGLDTIIVKFNTTPGAFYEALNIAISTLHAQQEAEKNEPLALEELLEMDGEPVWAVLLTKTKGNDSGWTLVYKNNGYSAAQRWTIWTLWYEDYGKTWLAYRRKPWRS